jgi:hypothetical protein
MYRYIKSGGQNVCALCSFIAFVAVGLFLAACGRAQNEQSFSIPLDDLERWSEQVTVRMSDVVVTASSRVHALEHDCEMHIAAVSKNFRGTPGELVLEPMNLCRENFFGASRHHNRNWEDFAESLHGASIVIEGVPRIWAEHLEESKHPSNPKHAVEFHPLTKIVHGSEAFDFSAFIYWPDGFYGGIKPKIMESIINKTSVEVLTKQNSVDIFTKRRDGNFTVVDVRLRKRDVRILEGGHRMEGDIILSNGSKTAHLVTVQGSAIDGDIEAFRNGNREEIHLKVLVLFSLSPLELYHTALKSRDSGNRETVRQPLQLIMYGEIKD